MKKLDFLFVVGGIPFSGISGGEKVIAVLANKLAENNYSVGILAIKDFSRFIENSQEFKRLNKIHLIKNRGGGFIRNLTRSFFYQLFYNTLGYKIFIKLFYRKINFDKKYIFSDKVKILFSYKKLKQIDIKNIIATAWVTAYVVESYNRKANKYYLIQNSEDDISYSGDLHEFAAKTYEFKDLQKIVINEATWKRFKNENPKRMVVGFDDKFRLITPIDKRDKIILFPLRQNQSKGAKYILEAVKNLKDRLPDYKFLSFGDYKESVPAYINHLGKISDEKLIELYNSACIFVFPSIVEGFSLILIEAMSCGAAVIATDCQGPNEFIENNKNEILIPIRDSGAIEKAVLYLSNNEEKRLMIAKNGLETAKKFTYDKMYESFINLFN